MWQSSMSATAEADREWLHVRRYLRRHRHQLAVSAAAELYPDVPRLAGTPLLTSPSWVPSRPIPLDSIALDLDLTRTDGPWESTMGTPRYSELVRRLDAPAVFENRRTYRLRAADLRSSRPRMGFGLGRYFDSIDTGEALAHDYAARKLKGESHASRRAAVPNPVDPARRPMNVAVSALTIRHDRDRDTAEFLVHWRDPAKVGHAGGLYHVLPVGVFQPATDHPRSFARDLSLWRCLVREYAEELLGAEEQAPSSGVVDYDDWAFAAELRVGRERGVVRAYCLGMGVDPLTLATDLLCAVVVDAAFFDRVFGACVRHNAEGRVVTDAAGRVGVPFVPSQVERFARHEPMQAAGAAVLTVAWQHRNVLLVR